MGMDTRDEVILVDQHGKPTVKADEDWKCSIPACSRRKRQKPDLLCNWHWRMVPSKVKRQFWELEKSGAKKKLVEMAVRIMAGAASTQKILEEKAAEASRPRIITEI